MVHDDKGVSICPSSFSEDTQDTHIAEMSLNSFMRKTGSKMLKDSRPDEWVETSSRARIRGMMDRYKDFCVEDVSLFSVFRVQERHWLAHCKTNDVLVAAKDAYLSASRILARSPYSDITNYKADVPDIELGKPYGSPINVKHHAAVASELAVFADALKLTHSDLIEVGRGWSISTVRGLGRELEYKEWADKVFQPIYDCLLQRAEHITKAYAEALYLLRLRRKMDTPKRGGH